MPLTQIRTEFLTDEEKDVLTSKKGKKRREEIEVRLIDTSLVEQRICLRRWGYGEGG
ncbi:hypothetical protein L1049_003429 [Liquidambar formosana]|uniref:Uncharacterized protein n=1 Tax=Liquidambar formosana TaxID=63359 RepID=A0AAP0QZW7_LIQFO